MSLIGLLVVLLLLVGLSVIALSAGQGTLFCSICEQWTNQFRVPYYVSQKWSDSLIAQVIRDQICNFMTITFSKQLCNTYVSRDLPRIIAELRRGASVPAACSAAACTPGGPSPGRSLQEEEGLEEPTVDQS